MIPVIRKILYTTDLSSNAAYAFAYAASLANRYGAEIIVLHVMEEFLSSQEMSVMSIIEEKEPFVKNLNIQAALELVRGRIEKFCQDRSEELPSCTFIIDQITVKIGNPVEEILNHAEKTGCDMIVMGARGHGLLADIMIGSTSRRVVRRSQKPVLVVRLPTLT